MSERMDESSTVLMMAAESGHLEVVRLLCDAGADLSNRKTNGSTTLMVAAGNGHARLFGFSALQGRTLGHQMFPSKQAYTRRR